MCKFSFKEMFEGWIADEMANDVLSLDESQVENVRQRIW